MAHLPFPYGSLGRAALRSRGHRSRITLVFSNPLYPPLQKGDKMCGFLYKSLQKRDKMCGFLYKRGTRCGDPYKKGQGGNYFSSSSSLPAAPELPRKVPRNICFLPRGADERGGRAGLSPRSRRSLLSPSLSPSFLSKRRPLL